MRRRDIAEPVDSRDTVVAATDGAVASDAAIRKAAAEAQRRETPLIVLMNYQRPIDPDLDEFETPIAVLEARARRRASDALCRALSLPEDLLPQHRIVPEHRELTYVLLRNYRDAALIVVCAERGHQLRRMLGGYVSVGRLARRSSAPVLVVPQVS